VIYRQFLLDLHDELIADLFAGGGGASCGIEMATGRQVDLAINHDPAAVALHQANHPQTQHFTCDVFEVDPRAVTQGRRIGLLWASPDCTYHSKARGGKPLRDGARKRRALAWVVTRWAGQVRPRVIMLENVEEFAKWGPLVGPPDQLRPDARRAGRTFRKWVRSLERLGYVVEWRELRACDYGAPTIRKRLFLIARCDGRPIVWPAPTHGPGTRKPYRTAAECIDWSVPMLSIFASRQEARTWAKALGVQPPVRPLAPATLRRVARGVMRYVVQAAEPFIVPVQNASSAAPAPLGEPLRTITAYPKGGGFALAAPFLTPRYGERDGQEPRARSVQQPAPVVVPTGNGASLCAAFLAKHYGGHETPGSALPRPADTITTTDHNALVAAGLAKLRGTSSVADPGEPLHTVSAGGQHHAIAAAHLSTYYGGPAGEARGADPREPLRTQSTENRHGVVAAFLDKYYGTDQDPQLREPLHTITTKHRFGLVTVTVNGEPYVISDIAMRMLQPRELYNAQGFPPGYVIDRGADGRQLTKTEQVRMVGNSVCPPMAAALARANVPELVARDEAAA
jgi:DNA (cytosine-5)-methyltransferase 1